MAATHIALSDVAPGYGNLRAMTSIPAPFRPLA